MAGEGQRGTRNGSPRVLSPSPPSAARSPLAGVSRSRCRPGGCGGGPEREREGTAPALRKNRGPPWFAVEGSGLERTRRSSHLPSCWFDRLDRDTAKTERGEGTKDMRFRRAAAAIAAPRGELSDAMSPTNRIDESPPRSENVLAASDGNIAVAREEDAVATLSRCGIVEAPTRGARPCSRSSWERR